MSKNRHKTPKYFSNFPNFFKLSKSISIELKPIKSEDNAAGTAIHRQMSKPRP